MKKRILALLLGGPLLTACPSVGEPPLYLSYRFTFSLPRPVNDANARVTAIAYLYERGASTPTIKSMGVGSVDQNSSTADLFLNNFDLDTLAKDARCLGPFKGGQDTQDLDPATLVVKPDTVNTCQVFFVLYSDANGDGVPQEQEVIYDTNDQYVYADQDFTYSGQDKSGLATEQGTRTRGWSLVRHSVIQPSDTPGHYQVTMNSEAARIVNGYAEPYQLRLHEPSNFFSSMSVRGQK